MPIDRLDYLRYVGQMFGGFRIRHERWFWQLRRDDLARYLDWQRSLDILDLANGRLRPHYTLLAREGHRVYGIDLINCPSASRTDRAYQLARWLFEREAGYHVTQRRLLGGNVNRLPFGVDAFDLVTSIAALEHFLDVPQVLMEATRVLRPGGLIWAAIHIFTAPSGGHNVSLSQVPLRRLPAHVDAWDHLRHRRLPFHVPLNEWRIDQYLAEFSKHFEILKHYCAMREGEEFLTPAIEAELAAYSRDELTCGAYVIVARKPYEGAQRA